MKTGQKLGIPLFLIGIGNLISGITSNKSIWFYPHYVIVFFIVGILLTLNVLKVSKNALSIILLLFSLLALWFDDVRSLTGIFLFTYSIYLSKRKSIGYWIYGLLSVTSIMGRFFIDGLSANQMIIYLSGTSFVVIVYIYYIHQKENTCTLDKDYFALNLSKDVIDILELRVQGYDWPEINDILELNVTDERVRRKVTEESRKHGFKNREAFIFALTEKGVIKSIPSKLKNMSL